MADDTVQSADSKPESDEPTTWEKQKNLELRQRFFMYAKKFAIGFIILLVVSLIFKYTDYYNIEDEVSLAGYNISILSFLTFLWIILFTLFLSHAVPIGLLTFINRFLVQMRETGPEEVYVPEEVISDAESAAGTEESGDGAGQGSEVDQGEVVADPDGPQDVGDDDKTSEDEGNEDSKDSGEKDGTQTEDVLLVPPAALSQKDEEKEKKRSKLAIIPLITSLRPDSTVPEGKAPQHAENLFYSFLRYMIIIIGFTYAFFALGLDLEKTVCFLGEDVAVEIMLEIILTAIVTAVFIFFFLPPFLNLLQNVMLRRYAKRVDTTESRVKRMRDEVDKVRPGLQKTLAILIVLFAALNALSLIDCSPSYAIVPEWNEDQGQFISTLIELPQTELCEYIEIAEMIVQAVAILVAALMLTTITPLLVYMMSTSDEDIRKSGMYKAGRYINYFILIIAMFLIMSVVGLDLSTSIPIGESKLTLWSIVSAIVVIILSHILAKLLTAILRDTALNPKQMEEHASIIMEKLIHFVIVAIGCFVALGILGINILALATGLGLLGFALAFGMQDTIANFVAGIMIAIERPFQIGDRVRIGDEWGDVIDIGMRSTKIRTAKNETVVIPNNLVATREVWNYTKDSPVIANVIPIGISYDSDPVLAERIILEEAQKHPHIIDRPKAHVRMIEYGESSIDFELWAWISNARQRDIARSDLLKAIQHRFREEGIEIPFPHRTLTFKKGAAEEIADALKK